jgi:hypothetical protein
MFFSVVDKTKYLQKNRQRLLFANYRVEYPSERRTLDKRNNTVSLLPLRFHSTDIPLLQENRTMKKLVLLSAAVILLSAFTAGCSSRSGSSSWCRSGSLFPTARNKQNTETVYLSAAASASQCDPCSANQCQPCEPAACQPCEPIACQPCEPACNPCDNRSIGAVRGVVVPGPAQ